MIKLEKLNVVVEVDSEAKAHEYELQGYVRVEEDKPKTTRKATTAK